MSEDNDGQRPGGSSLMAVYSLGLTLAVGMALFVFGGYVLDRRSGGGMGWTLAGAAMGIVFCAYEVWRILRTLQDDVRKESGKGSP